MRILVTGGGTREPIDRVRYIGNFSTGGTASAIADYLAERGHAVTYLAGEGSSLPSSNCRILGYRDFRSLDELLRDQLGTHSFDSVIHAAAVADFTPVERDSGKIDSSDELVLRLRRTPKLIVKLRDLSRNPTLLLIAFKLTSTESSSERQAAVTRLAELALPDAIVHNDMTEMGERAEHRRFSLLMAPFRLPGTSLANRAELSHTLAELIESRRPKP